MSNYFYLPKVPRLNVFPCLLRCDCRKNLALTNRRLMLLGCTDGDKCLVPPLIFSFLFYCFQGYPGLLEHPCNPTGMCVHFHHRLVSYQGKFLLSFPHCEWWDCIQDLIRQIMPFVVVRRLEPWWTGRRLCSIDTHIMEPCCARHVSDTRVVCIFKNLFHICVISMLVWPWSCNTGRMNNTILL